MRKSRGPPAARGGGGVGSGRNPLLNSNFINSYIEQIPKIRPRTPPPSNKQIFLGPGNFFFLDPRVKYYEGNPSHTNLINDVKMIFSKI